MQIKTGTGRLNALHQVDKKAPEVFLPVKAEMIERIMARHNDTATAALNLAEIINLNVISYKTLSKSLGRITFSR